MVNMELTDIRCGCYWVELNGHVVMTAIEEMLEKEYGGTEDLLLHYMTHLEHEYNKNTSLEFNEWLVDNYDNIEAWNDIQDYMENVEQ